MNTIDLPPYAPKLIESTRSLGYSLSSAIADIIDNSISAGADYINISYIPTEDTKITILDNGTGMDEEEINRAMQYGSIDPNETRDLNDLGRFGLGLKTASLSQCRSLTVISKKNGIIHGRRWDIDVIAEMGSWALLVLNEEDWRQYPETNELCSMESGTLIVWEKLDRLKEGEVEFNNRLGELMISVQNHISLVFHRYIRGENDLRKVKICFNYYPVEAADPFLVEKSIQTMSEETIILHGEKVKIRPYLLPHPSKLSREDLKKLGGKDEIYKNQGYYIYRNKRLIIWGDWFRTVKKNEITQLARIQVDIPNTLDSLWTLDVKKSIAKPPMEIMNSLKSIAATLTNRSKKTWIYRGKKELSSDKNPIWERNTTREGNHYLTINRAHPLVEYLKSQLNNKNSIEILLGMIEKNIPYTQIYIDMSDQGKPAGEEKLLSKEEINRIIESYKSMDIKTAQLLFQVVKDKEPYLSNPRLAERIEREVFDD